MPIRQCPVCQVLAGRSPAPLGRCLNQQCPAFDSWPEVKDQDEPKAKD